MSLPTVNDPATVTAVTAAFEAYESALVENDVDALCGFFWDSPLAVRFGTDEQLYGNDAIKAFRADRVINFSQRTGRRVEVTTFGTDVASVMYEYDARFGDHVRPGRQSQLWLRLDGIWRIAAAHVSRGQPTPTPGQPDWGLVLDQLAAAQQLSIAPAHREGVIHNLVVVSRLAQPLMDFDLPAHVEPAPVYTP